MGFVERVEMNARDGLVEQFGALLGSVVNACAFDGFGDGIGAVQGFDQFCRVTRTGREFGHAFHAGE